MEFGEHVAIFYEQVVERRLEEAFGSVLIIANMAARMEGDEGMAHREMSDSCQLKLCQTLEIEVKRILTDREIVNITGSKKTSSKNKDADLKSDAKRPQSPKKIAETAQERRARLVEQNKKHKLKQQQKLQKQQNEKERILQIQADKEAGDAARLERAAQLCRLVESLGAIATATTAEIISTSRKNVVDLFAELVCAGLKERLQLVLEELEAHRSLLGSSKEVTVHASDDDPYLKTLSNVFVFADALIEKLLLGEYAVAASAASDDGRKDMMVTHAIAKDVERQTSVVIVKIIDYFYTDKHVDDWVKMVQAADSRRKPGVAIPWEKVAQMDEILNDLMEAQQYCGHFTRFLQSLEVLGDEDIRQGAVSMWQLKLASASIVLETAWVSLSMSKAREISETTGEGTERVNTIVENTFYVTRKAFARAVHTESSDAAAAIANHIYRLVEDSYSTAIFVLLDEGVLGEGDKMTRHMSSENEDTDLFAAAFDEAFNDGSNVHASMLIAINTVELSATCTQNFMEEVKNQFEARFPDKLMFVEMAIEGLRSVSERHRSSCTEQLRQVVGNALLPTMRSSIHQLLSAIKYDSHEYSDFERYEREDPFVSKFIRYSVIENRSFVKCYRNLSPKNFNMMLITLVEGIVHAVEMELYKHQFSALGALRLESDLHSLMSCLSDINQQSLLSEDHDVAAWMDPDTIVLKDSIRGHFSRLFQFAFLVSLEDVSLVEQVAYPVAPVLTHDEVIHVLRCRDNEQEAEIIGHLDLSKHVAIIQ